VRQTCLAYLSSSPLKGSILWVYWFDQAHVRPPLCWSEVLGVGSSGVRLAKGAS